MTDLKMPFKANFSQFGYILYVGNTAVNASVDALVLCPPRDGGSTRCKFGESRCFITDLTTGRDESSFFVEAAEARVIQELLWLHAAGLIQTCLHGSIRDAEAA
jgi:hypothetical protein